MAWLHIPTVTDASQTMDEFGTDDSLQHGIQLKLREIFKTNSKRHLPFDTCTV